MGLRLTRSSRRIGSAVRHVELRPVPELDAEQLERAATRLERWRARYGDGPELAARRSGAVLARLEHQGRATAARFAPRRRDRRDALNTSGPPYRAPPATAAVLQTLQGSVRPPAARASARKGQK